jgi:hypothetical protein
LAHVLGFCPIACATLSSAPITLIELARMASDSFQRPVAKRGGSAATFPGYTVDMPKVAAEAKRVSRPLDDPKIRKAFARFLKDAERRAPVTTTQALAARDRGRRWTTR